MKIVTVVGTRPNFIKLAPLSRELRKNDNHTEIIIHTGQHYDYQMSESFFNELKIPEPDYNLGIGSGTHGGQMGNLMIKLDETIEKERPDLVIVFGDVNSSFAGAFVSARRGIPVAHVEAGLRSGDITMPEEQNRIFTDILSTLLFCPTSASVENLVNEGHQVGVFWVGDLMIEMIDTIREVSENSRLLEKFGLEPFGYVVATVHRQSNTDIRENLENIVKAFGMIDYPILFPIHPRTKKAIENYGITLPSNVIETAPLGYLDMIKAISNSFKVITDSGGIQKEAHYLGIPCVTMRDTTEWPETLEFGWNILTGTNPDMIFDATSYGPIPSSKWHFSSVKKEASIEIVSILNQYEEAIQQIKEQPPGEQPE